TSRLLQSLVVEKACQMTTLIDTELVLRKYPHSREIFVSGRLVTSNSQSRLFELRLELRKPHGNFNKRIKRANQLTACEGIRPNY
ncbi:hypothetical protein PENTCL1PPCAC_24936, partial [Pristionchus entomophagus]